MSIAAILLADRDVPALGGPPALLPWHDGETLVEYQVAQLLEAGVGAVEVVLGADADRIIPLVARDNVEPVVNARWRDGVAGSLRVGASAVPRGTETALIVEVIQPRPAEIYRRLLDAHLGNGAGITVPTFKGTAGRPIVVDTAALAELRNLTAPGNLEMLIERHATVHLVPLDDSIVLLEIATREEYESAHLRLG
ncbi:MAG: NTP transferase domain-containing protein [Dehalococcoidia bacterium]